MLPSVMATVLRGYRERLRLSQEDLAHRADVDRTYVGKMERGLLNPTFVRIARLLGAMGITWREFGEALDGELDAASENRAAGRARRPPVPRAP
jgi:transcriptional regulator with XRE-family HTH domain